MGLLSVVLRFPEAPAGARREQQAGKAGSRQHPAVIDAPQAQLARTERCPWAAALLSHGFEATVRAHGTGLDPWVSAWSQGGAADGEGAPSSPWLWGRARLRGLPGARGWGVLAAVQCWAVGEGGTCPSLAGPHRPQGSAWAVLSTGSHGRSCVPVSRRAGAVGGSSGAVRASACSFAGGDAFLCF